MNMDRLKNNLISGIATAKGVDGDFIYITVGDAKRIIRMIGEREPKTVNDMRQIKKIGLSGYCPTCKRALDQMRFSVFQEETKFCPSCGQAVKWE